MNHMKKRIAIGLAILLAVAFLAMPAAAADKKKDGGKVNINTATEEELLTKINWDYDETYVKRAVASIVKWREDRGPFKNINDLILLPTMNGAVMMNIEKQITVGD